MTFKETDFPALIKFLKTFSRNESDPLLFKEVVARLVTLYEDVPLYPGIVNMCLSGLQKKLPPRDIEEGQKIYVKNGEDCFCGTVVRKDADGVTLKAVRSVVSEDEYELEYKEMEHVTLVNDKVLQEMWPSLVFPKEGN